MIIWGSGGDVINLGEVKQEECSICEKKRPFNLYLTYRYGHIYWLGFLTKVEYHIACDICNRGVEVDEKDVAEFNGKSQVPFMRRWGLLSGIAVLWILGAIVLS